MEVQKEVEKNALDEYFEMVINALESIRNTKFNAPSWPIWKLVKELPNEQDIIGKEKRK